MTTKAKCFKQWIGIHTIILWKFEKARLRKNFWLRKTGWNFSWFFLPKNVNWSCDSNEKWRNEADLDDLQWWLIKRKLINLEASAPLDILPCGPSTNHKDHKNVQQKHDYVHLVLPYNPANISKISRPLSSESGSARPATALRIRQTLRRGVVSGHPNSMGRMVRLALARSPPPPPPPPPSSSTSTFCNAELRRPPCSVLRTACNFCLNCMFQMSLR